MGIAYANTIPIGTRKTQKTGKNRFFESTGISKKRLCRDWCIGVNNNRFNFTLDTRIIQHNLADIIH